MSPVYGTGHTPDCYRCNSQPYCVGGGEGCQEARDADETLGYLFDAAKAIAQIHDPEKRTYLAEALAEAAPDILPDDWFDADMEAEFLSACGASRKPKAKAAA